MIEWKEIPKYEWEEKPKEGHDLLVYGELDDSFPRDHFYISPSYFYAKYSDGKFIDMNCEENEIINVTHFAYINEPGIN